MIIEILDANYSSIKNFTKEEYYICRQILSYSTPTYFNGQLKYSKQFLLHGRTFRFPTGALSIFLNHKLFKNIKYEINDLTKDKKEIFTIPINKKILEEYQQYTIEEINKYQRCIIQLPTGAGKSYMISYIASNLKQSTIIIVPTEEILYQIKKQLTEVYKEKNIGIVHGSKEEINKRIILTTGQTLYSRYELYNEEEKFNHIKCILADEVQYYGSNTFFVSSFLFPNAYFRLGFSATPLGRSDNADLRTLSIFSNHIVTYDISKIKRVVPLQVIFIKYDHIPKINISSNNNNVDEDNENPFKIDTPIAATPYDKLLQDTSRLHAISLLLQKLIDRNLSFICFVDRLEYGEIISNLVNIPFVHSKNPSRSTIINDLKEKKLLGIVSTIGKEGLDIPSLNIVVNTSREATPISLGQKAGRARRKTQEKDEAIIFDFNDHQFFSSIKWSKRREKVYKSFTQSISYLKI